MRRIVAPFFLALSLVTTPAVAGNAPAPYAAGKVALEVNGGHVVIKSVQGLGAARKVAGDGQGLKPAALTPVDVVLLPVRKTPFLSWMIAAMNGKTSPETVRLKVFNYDFEIKQIYDLSETSIAEVGFPGADASSKEPVYLRVRLLAERLAFAEGEKGAKIDVSAGKAQKLLLPQNFRFTIEGLDATKILKIAPFTLRPGKGDVEVSTIEIVIPAAYAEDWMKWAQQTLLSGNESKPKTARLDYLDGARTFTLLSVSFSGVELQSFDIPLGGAAEATPQITFKLYAKGANIK